MSCRLLVSPYAYTLIRLFCRSRSERRLSIVYCGTDLNLPLSAIAFTLVLVFLRLRKPHIESYAAAFLAVDWM